MASISGRTFCNRWYPGSSLKGRSLLSTKCKFREISSNLSRVIRVALEHRIRRPVVADLGEMVEAHDNYEAKVDLQFLQVGLPMCGEVC